MGHQLFQAANIGSKAFFLMRCKTREAKPRVQRPRVSAMIPSPIIASKLQSERQPEKAATGAGRLESLVIRMNGNSLSGSRLPSLLRLSL